MSSVTRTSLAFLLLAAHAISSNNQGTSLQERYQLPSTMQLDIPPSGTSLPDSWHITRAGSVQDFMMTANPVPVLPGQSQPTDSVLEVRFPAGSFAPSQSANAGGVNFYAQPFEPTNYTRAYLAYDVAFPPDFIWAKGGKLPGIYGGDPDGACNGGTPSDKCFSSRFMWREQGASEVYTYLPVDEKSEYCKRRMVSCTDKYGQSAGRGQLNINSGNWTRLEMFTQMNAPGISNGILSVAVNGAIVYEDTQVPWRTRESVAPSSLMFSSFFGGHDASYATPKEQKIYFRNITMAMDSTPIPTSAGHHMAAVSVALVAVMTMLWSVL